MHKNWIAGLLLALCCMAPAGAWDSVSHAPAGSAEPVLLNSFLGGFAMSPDGSAWALDADNATLRLSAGQALRIRRYTDFHSRYGAGARPLADGGALLLGFEPCEIHRLDSAAQWRWRHDGCAEVLPATDGGTWLWQPQYDGGQASLRRLGSDGMVTFEASPALLAETGADRAHSLLVAPDGGIYVLSRDSATGGAIPRLARIGRDGRMLWRWQAAAAWPDWLHAAVGPDGGVVLAAIGSTANSVQAARITASGQLAWTSRNLPAPADGQITDDSLVATNDGGAILALHTWRQQNSAAVLRLGSTGTLSWQAATPGISWGDTYAPPLGEGSNSSVQVIGPQLGGGLRYYRFSRQGQLLADRSVQASGWSWGSSSLYLRGVPGLEPIARLTEAGEAVATVHTGASIAPEMGLLASTGSGDGAQFLLSSEVNESGTTQTPHYALTRINADGSQPWHMTSADALIGSTAITANAQRVCIFVSRDISPPDGNALYESQVICHDAQTGARLWSQSFPYQAVDDGAPKTISLLDADRVLLSSAERTLYQPALRLLDANGQLLKQTWLSGTLWISASRGDRVALLFSTPDAEGRQLFVYDAEGNQRLAVNSGELDMNPQQLVLGADGSVALSGRQRDTRPGSVVVYYNNPATARRWRRDLPTVSSSFDNTQLTPGDAAVYLTQRSAARPMDTPMLPTRITRLDADAGAVGWQAESLNPANRRQLTALSADGARLLSVHGQRGRMRLELFDSHRGERLRERYEACEAFDCEPAAVSNDADATTRIAADVLRNGQGYGAAVYAGRGLDSAGSVTRLDQPGISGAWWSPYANGEGLVLDWLADSRTLFAAWFTYTRDGRNDPADLRWYTLQANAVAEAATTLELPILETRGGNFAAAPPVVPQQVGSAMLDFSDCDNATLRYTFDAGHNGGAAGTITLSRLTPATQSCILADGSIRPGAGAQPAQNGFDARMAGTWFSETLDGQGLQFTVQPGGVFFAPWFTYDPAGAGNDPGRQHWFTLQGNLALASNATAELLLVQTVGGRFDSLPTYNAYQVGTATLTMNGCDRASLEYRFGNDERAGPYANRSGLLDLVKIGGCAP